MLNPTVLQKLTEWKKSPLLFVTECIGAKPSLQQTEALLELPTSKRMTIRSGHGTGKSAFTTWAILWFQSTRTFPKVACTAPTARQLSDVLWAEMSKWLRQSLLRDEFVIQKDKIFYKEHPKEWWVRAISPSVKASKEEQAETLAGLHADHLLVCVDEASGVPDPIYIPLEGALTQEDNRVLLIGNPTKNHGYFYDTHFHPTIRQKWNRFHWNAEKSELVTEAQIAYMADKYGKDSNVYRIRVLGEPPTDDDLALIPMSWAIQCCDNEVAVSEDEPLYLGVDVARYGDDKSVILPRRGLKIDPWESFQGMNTIELAQLVGRNLVELEADGAAIDEIGVGAGVVDYLMKQPQLRGLITGVNVAMVSSDRTKWRRLRDELWLSVREKCMKGVYSFPGGKLGEEICNELAMIRYELEGGVYTVESKKKMKLRAVKSPNIADALCLTEYFHDVAARIWGKKTQERRKNKLLGKDSFPKGRNAWMAA